MVLNKREKSIAIALVAVVGLVLVYNFGIEKYWDARTQAVAERDTAEQKLRQADNLMLREKKLRPVWSQLISNGLTATPSDAQAQLLNSMNTWVQESGIALSSMHPERLPTAPEKDKQFIRVGVKLAGSGPMSAVAKLMFRLETAKIPLNVEDMQINQRKDGADDLQITVTLSTLCLAPGADNKPAKANARSVADARGERQ